MANIPIRTSKETLGAHKLGGSNASTSGALSTQSAQNKFGNLSKTLDKIGDMFTEAEHVNVYNKTMSDLMKYNRESITSARDDNPRNYGNWEGMYEKGVVSKKKGLEKQLPRALKEKFGGAFDKVAEQGRMKISNFARATQVSIFDADHETLMNEAITDFASLNDEVGRNLADFEFREATNRAVDAGMISPDVGVARQEKYRKDSRQGLMYRKTYRAETVEELDALIAGIDDKYNPFGLDEPEKTKWIKNANAYRKALADKIEEDEDELKADSLVDLENQTRLIHHNYIEQLELGDDSNTLFTKYKADMEEAMVVLASNQIKINPFLANVGAARRAQIAAVKKTNDRKKMFKVLDDLVGSDTPSYEASAKFAALGKKQQLAVNLYNREKFWESKGATVQERKMLLSKVYDGDTLGAEGIEDALSAKYGTQIGDKTEFWHAIASKTGMLPTDVKADMDFSLTNANSAERAIKLFRELEPADRFKLVSKYANPFLTQLDYFSRRMPFNKAWEMARDNNMRDTTFGDAYIEANDDYYKKINNFFSEQVDEGVFFGADKQFSEAGLKTAFHTLVKQVLQPGVSLDDATQIAWDQVGQNFGHSRVGGNPERTQLMMYPPEDFYRQQGHSRDETSAWVQDDLRMFIESKGFKGNISGFTFGRPETVGTDLSTTSPGYYLYFDGLNPGKNGAPVIFQPNFKKYQDAGGKYPIKKEGSGHRDVLEQDPDYDERTDGVL